jgi:indole-3-glycerol phosphate synthase
MVDEYQFYEAKSIGADVILLIAVSFLIQVQEFTALAHELNWKFYWKFTPKKN